MNNAIDSPGPYETLADPRARPTGGNQTRTRVAGGSAKLSAVGVALVLAAGLAWATPSRANGPCGQNFDGNHACGVNSPATYPGSLTTDNESDYYMFSAQPGTGLSVSITDTENPGCSTSFTDSCGWARVALLDGSGNDLDESASSQPANGITVPGSFSHTLGANTYYLVVSGSLGSDSNSNPVATPYTLSVDASPAVQWPPPPAVFPGTHKVRRCRMRRIRRHHHRVRVRVCRTVTVPY